MRTILLTGKTGQVGWELQRTLAPLGNVVAVDRAMMDLSQPDSIIKIVRAIKPTVLVNAAAYTAVDKAEGEEELAMAVNGTAPGILAEEVKRLGGILIHYSTDYVFDGAKRTPYVEEDQPAPLNVYGKTKLAGEQAVQAVGVPYLILRTSWVYSTRGKNFLLTILRLAKEREELEIVDDQFGVPTSAELIADVTALVLYKITSVLSQSLSCLQKGGTKDTGDIALQKNEMKGYEDQSLMKQTGGVYHLSAAGETSWYHYAHFILDIASKRGISLRVSPDRIISTTTADSTLLAKRPVNSCLDTGKLQSTFGLALPQWQYYAERAVLRFYEKAEKIKEEIN